MQWLLHLVIDFLAGIADIYGTGLGNSQLSTSGLQFLLCSHSIALRHVCVLFTAILSRCGILKSTPQFPWGDLWGSVPEPAAPYLSWGQHTLDKAMLTANTY